LILWVYAIIDAKRTAERINRRDPKIIQNG